MKQFLILFPLTLAIAGVLVYFSIEKVDESNPTHTMNNSSTTIPSTPKPVEQKNTYAIRTENKKNEDKNQINEQTSITEELEERYRSASNNDDYPTLSSRVNAIKERRPDANITSEDIVDSLEKSQAWESKDDPGIAEQKLTPEELNDGRAFIEFDPVKVETLMPGDQMNIAIDSIGRTFEMEVENVKVYDDGNIMWQGRIINEEGTDAENGTVNITQSTKVTVATVVLRETDYTLESYGTDGWIVDSSTLFKVDPNHTDIEIPPEEHGHK